MSGTADFFEVDGFAIAKYQKKSDLFEREEFLRDLECRNIKNLFTFNFYRSEFDTLNLIESFLLSPVAEQLDIFNSWQMLTKMPYCLRTLSSDWHIKTNGFDYDRFVLGWMAGIYSVMRWDFGMACHVIANAANPEWLYRSYSPLHETSDLNAVKK